MSQNKTSLSIVAKLFLLSVPIIIVFSNILGCSASTREDLPKTTAPSITEQNEPPLTMATEQSQGEQSGSDIVDETEAVSGFDLYEIVISKSEDGSYTDADMRYSAKLLLPQGWLVKQGTFDGIGYYPSEEFASLSLTASRLGAKRTYSLYDEQNVCVGTIGVFTWSLSDEDVQSVTSSELKELSFKFGFAEVRMGSLACLITAENDAHTVPCDSDRFALVCHTGYRNIYTDEQIELPAAAALDVNYCVGIMFEFANDVLTETQLDTIASSVRFTVFE